MKPKVLVTRKMFPEVLAYLEEHAEIEGGRKAEGIPREALKTQIGDYVMDNLGMEKRPQRREAVSRCAFYLRRDLAFLRSGSFRLPVR